MERVVENSHRSSILAEGALRNLHLDCMVEGSDQTFSSRMLHWGEEGLVIADPARRNLAYPLTQGDRLICSGRFGSDIFRFQATVAGRRWYQLNANKRIAAILMIDVTEPSVVQRRRYFRVSLAAHCPTDVTFWIVEQGDEGAKVVDEFTGQILDVSGGGAGILIENPNKVHDLDEKQLWARFMLPGENESLIFQVEVRHIRPVQGRGTYNMGLEFVEYIDPGQRSLVIDNIVRFVSRQERIELRRRKDR